MNGSLVSDVEGRDEEGGRRKREEQGGRGMGGTRKGRVGGIERKVERGKGGRKERSFLH